MFLLLVVLLGRLLLGRRHLFFVLGYLGLFVARRALDDELDRELQALTEALVHAQLDIRRAAGPAHVAGRLGARRLPAFVVEAFRTFHLDLDRERQVLTELVLAAVDGRIR